MKTEELFDFVCPIFRYTNPVATVHSFEIFPRSFVRVIGDPDNGAYEWVIVECGKVTSHSDCAYGQSTIALRDGLTEYHK